MAPPKRLLLALTFTVFAVAACADPSTPSRANTTPQDVAAQSPATATSPAAASPTPILSPAPPVAAAPVAAPVATDPYAAATAAGASAVCADGTWSYSQNRSGTCSHHGVFIGGRATWDPLDPGHIRAKVLIPDLKLLASYFGGGLRLRLRWGVTAERKTARSAELIGWTI